MLRNIIIVLVSVGIISWNLYVFKKRKSLSFTAKNFAIGFLVLWLFSTFIFNIPVILSPLTPAINGTVIDAETKQPVANCNIKAYWQIMSAIPGGGGGADDTYHQFITKTNERGEFQIPRYIKVLGLYGLLPIVFSHYDGVEIIAYSHGFRYSSEKVDQPPVLSSIFASFRPTATTLTIEMRKSRRSDITNDIFSLDYIMGLYNLPRGKTAEDNKYLLDDYHYYYDRMQTIYKNSSDKEIEAALIYFASAFKEFGEKEKAIEIYQRLKRDIPGNAIFADREIEQLKMKNVGGSR